jgi:hypothetical protein
MQYLSVFYVLKIKNLSLRRQWYLTALFYPEIMKRLLIAFIALGLFALAMASCSSSTDCPAYGEVHKYQIEQRY